VGIHIFFKAENQTETVGHLLGFTDAPRIEWAIQRPDGAVWQGSTRAVLPITHRFGAGNPVPFLSSAGAQAYIDSMQRSNYHRAAFRDCVPAKLMPFVDGDHGVCACGQIHEADYCPSENGHGVVL